MVMIKEEYSEKFIAEFLSQKNQSFNDQNIC